MFKINSMAYEVPLVSDLYAERFIQFMENRGISRDALLEGTGLKDVLSGSVNTLLSMNQLTKLMESSQRFIDDDLAGFDGLLGFALLKQKDFRDLANMIVQYLRVSLPILDMKVSCSGEEIRIALIDVWDLGNLRPFFVKVYMGSIYALTSLICRRFYFEFDFAFSHDDENWKRLAPHARLSFSASQNQVVLPLSGRPARDGNEELSYYLASARSRDEVKRNEHMETAARVRELVSRYPGREGTLERVGEKMGMSARSLRYHLKMAGVSFHDIRNEVRKTFAVRYLKETSMPLNKIAEVLGYSDQASFTKAYRGWTGVTPGDTRRKFSSTPS